MVNTNAAVAGCQSAGRRMMILTSTGTKPSRVAMTGFRSISAMPDVSARNWERATPGRPVLLRGGNRVTGQAVVAAEVPCQQKAADAGVSEAARDHHGRRRLLLHEPGVIERIGHRAAGRQ